MLSKKYALNIKVRLITRVHGICVLFGSQDLGRVLKYIVHYLQCVHGGCTIAP